MERRLRFRRLRCWNCTISTNAGRILPAPGDLLAVLREEHGAEIANVPVGALVSAAAGLTWTRDAFDRLIVGHAIAAGVPLVTSDRLIRANFPGAVW